MINKKFHPSASVTELLSIALMFGFIQLWGTSLHNSMNKVFDFAIQGLLIASWRICRLPNPKEHVNSQDYKQTEVQFGLK